MTIQSFLHSFRMRSRIIKSGGAGNKHYSYTIEQPDNALAMGAIITAAGPALLLITLGFVICRQ
jgi:hypothetical protein